MNQMGHVGSVHRGTVPWIGGPLAVSVSRKLSALVIAGLLLAVANVTVGHPGLHHDLERVSQALSKEPDRVDLLVKRGRLFRLDAHPRASLVDLDRAFRLAPDDRGVALERGLTLSTLRRDQEAEAELTRFIRLGGTASVAYAERGHVRARGRQLEPAIADYSAALERKPVVDVYLARAHVQEASGRLDAAAKGLSDGLSKLGGAVVLREALIRIETARRRFDVAIALIDEVLVTAQVKTEWYLRRGNVWKAAGDVAEARRDYDRALAEANRVLGRRVTAIHLCSRAKVHLGLGQTAEARRDLRAALEKSPRFAEARTLLAPLEREDKKDEVRRETRDPEHHGAKSTPKR